MDAVARGAYRCEGVDPNIVIDVEELVSGEVHTVDVEFAFAVLPLSASPLRTRYQGRRGPGFATGSSAGGWPVRCARCTRSCAGSTDPGGYPAANGRAPRESRRRGRL